MIKKNKIKVAVGLSGGVDSSVAALLLKEKGYDVTGVYMRNWSEELPEIKGCPWEVDQRDAELVAQQLGIPFYVVNFEKEYYNQVVKYMIDAYQSGITPNPDIMCNQEIKFGVFLEKMERLGFDKIATGHYARVEEKDNQYKLLAGKDNNKDQSYFLCRLNQEQLSKAMFPIGEIEKKEVRELAAKAGLNTSDKKDSQGICFIGDIKVRDFLKRWLKPTVGKIVDIHHKKILGQHIGLEYFTIGQREGIEVGGTGPYYVVERDFKTGELLVTNKQDDQLLYKQEFQLDQISWIARDVKLPFECGFRIRYRDKIIPGVLDSNNIVKLESKQRAVTAGQSAVFYRDDEVLGSGIII
ncbi:MAG: tRNA 2-thiouridine(34) synthase MnmA [Candidatus Komeilibacteria bacterium]